MVRRAFPPTITLMARPNWSWKSLAVPAPMICTRKKNAYRRNGIREYLAWITAEQRLIWWELREAEYQEIASAPDGLLKSGIFPGLWLETPALLRGDLKVVLATLRRGLESPEHRAFLSS